MVWPQLKILWHGEENSAGGGGGGGGQLKEQKGEDDRRRDGKITSRNGQGWSFPEGSGRQGRVERYCCNVSCGAPRLRD